MEASATSVISPKTLLVVDSSSEHRAFVFEQGQKSGLSVIMATDPTVAITTLDMALPDIVLADMGFPDMGSVDLIRQIKARRPACSVIGMGPPATQEATLAALRAGAIDYLSKPFGPEELTRALERGLRAIPMTLEDSPGILSVEHLVTVKPDPAHVETTVAHVLSKTVVPLTEPQREHLRSALHELLLNAIEHGSLDISFRVKQEALARDHYERLVADRLRDPRFKNRHVRIRTIYDKAARLLQFRIEDEGKGFGWRTLLRKGPDPVSAGFGCGRGIFVARTFFPDLFYNDQGNEAILTLPVDA